MQQQAERHHARSRAEVAAVGRHAEQASEQEPGIPAAGMSVRAQGGKPGLEQQGKRPGCHEKRHYPAERPRWRRQQQHRSDRTARGGHHDPSPDPCGSSLEFRA